MAELSGPTATSLDRGQVAVDFGDLKHGTKLGIGAAAGRNPAERGDREQDQGEGNADTHEQPPPGYRDNRRRAFPLLEISAERIVP